MVYSPKHIYRDKDTAPAGSEERLIVGGQLSDDFEAIAEELKRTPIVASCKFAGNPPTLNYSHNVDKVECPAPGKSGYGTCRVTFKDQIPDFDLHYSVIVQPYGSPALNNHIIATVNYQDSGFVEWAYGYWNGSSWSIPGAVPSFAMICVDYQQQA